MAKPNLKDLSNSELEALYYRMIRYKDREPPSMVWNLYNAIVEAFDLADLEAELIERGYELPMSN